MTSSGVDVEQVRAWAAGQPGFEAAVDLLPRVDLLDRYARQGGELLGSSWFVDFDAAAVDVWPGGVLAPADVAVMAVAVSLAGVGPVVDEALDERDVSGSQASSGRHDVRVGPAPTCENGADTPS